jgi:hypothetical protein
MTSPRLSCDDFAADRFSEQKQTDITGTMSDTELQGCIECVDGELR